MAPTLEAAETSGQVHEIMATLARSRLLVNGALLTVADAAS